MKKIVWLAMVAVCLSTLTATGQTKTRGRKPLTEEQIVKEFEVLARKFCTYIEIIGSTGATTETEKEKIRNDSVERLFFRYDERYMLTTSGYNGIVTNRKKMKDYFYNLKKQSKRNNMSNIGNITTYKMDFHFSSKEEGSDNLKWIHYKTYDDGTREYHSEITFYQRYVKKTVNGYETIRERIEKDKKKMKIKKLVYPNGTEDYKLGDITDVKRSKTEDK